MRVHQALARAGVASRRNADALVAAGRVSVNGVVATVGQQVDPARDVLAVDGRAVAAPTEERWIVLNKPAGVLTSARDVRGRRTVFDVLAPKDRVPGLTYVGRLDYMTEGVLLLTTNGTAAHLLTHPSRSVPRRYRATVRGDVPTAVRAIRHGVRLDDGIVIASHVTSTPLGQGRWDLEITIAEGRNREIRRVCAAVQLRVERLVRTQYGPVHLDAVPLAPGATRPLTSGERRELSALVGTGGTKVAPAGAPIGSVNKDAGGVNTAPRRARMTIGGRKKTGGLTTGRK